MKLSLLGCALLASAATVAAAGPSRPSRRAVVGGPVLWHGIRAGMSPAQAQAALPGLHPDTNPSRLIGPATDVGGQSFTVNVDVSDGKVAAVNLGSEHAIPDPIKDALTAKYGAPMESYSCRMTVAMRLCSGWWRAPGRVQVSLSSTVMERGSITTISYEAPDLSGI